jgi:hypothetical protein
MLAHRRRRSLGFIVNRITLKERIVDVVRESPINAEQFLRWACERTTVRSPKFQRQAVLVVDIVLV